MKNSRLFEILYLLVEKRAVTAGELARRLEVSERTIYRDVDALSAAGIPVFTQKGQGGGIRLMDQFVLDKALLSQAQQDEILFALQAVLATGGAAEGDVSGWKLLHKIDPAENRTSVSRTMRMGKRNRRRFSRDGFSSFGCSGVSVSSATDTPNSLARAMRFVMSGVAALVSHLLTAWRLTPSRAPSSS